MNKEEILRAVQAGKINSEKAAEELRKIMKEAITTQPKEHPLSLPTEQFSPENQAQQDVVELREIEPGIVQVTMQDRGGSADTAVFSSIPNNPASWS